MNEMRTLTIKGTKFQIRDDRVDNLTYDNLSDRPFYDDTADNIFWDGDIEGLDSVRFMDTVLYRVAPACSIESALNATITTTTEVVSIDDVTLNVDEQDFYVLSNDNVKLICLHDDSIFVTEDVRSVVFVPNIKMIDSKFIPPSASNKITWQTWE